VHEPLAEPLELGGPGLAGGHLREIGIHAAVPAAEALDLRAGVELLDVVALAGRADERAGAATEAALGERGPLGRLEQLHHVLAVETLEIQVFQGQLAENFPGLFLLGPDCFLAGILQHGKAGRQLFAFFGVGLPVEAFAVHPAAHVAGWLCRVDAEDRAEAGLGRARAGHGDDDAVFAAGFIVGVGRFCQKDLVQNVKAPGVARAHAEEDEGLGGIAALDELDLLARHLEADEILDLREEQILGAADGVELLGERQALLPDREFCLSGRVVRGDVELLSGGKSLEQLVYFRERKFFHALSPPLS